MKLSIEPTVVLVPGRADDAVMERLDPEAGTQGSNHEQSMSEPGSQTTLKVFQLGDQFRLPYIVDIRPSGEFTYEGAKDKLLSLDVGADAGPQLTFVVPGDVRGFQDSDDGVGAGHQARLLRLSCWIDVESRLTVSRTALSRQPLS